jgi:hypothetical protein
MSAQNKGEVTLTFFYFLYIYIIKNSNMKSKLFLEEGEISRILNMHKKAIQEQVNVNGDEVENNQVQMDEELDEANDLMENTQTYVLPNEYYLEARDAGFLGGNAELKMFKGAKFNIDGKGILKSNTKYQFVDTVDGTVYIPGQDIPANYKIKLDGQGTITGTVTYVCGQGKFYTNYNTDYLLYDEDGKLSPKLSKLCQASKTQTPVKSVGVGGKVTTKSKCPKLEKTYLDKGYVMVTEKRYKELANDKTRVRKYAWCPISKTNIYFAKIIQGIPEKGGFPGGKVGGGGSLPFDYNEVITAINTKCPAGGGGGNNATGVDIDIDGEKIVPVPKMPMDVYNAIG